MAEKRNNKGQWVKGQSGNVKGRVPKPEIEELRNAIKTVEKQKKKKLLQHFIERAFKSDAVLVATIKKLVADKTQTDVDLGGEVNVNISLVDSDERSSESQ